MSVGKNSINRVVVASTEAAPVEEKKEVAKAPAKKATTTKKAPAKKAPAKKAAPAKKPAAPKAVAKKTFFKVGDALPYYLL